MQTHSSSVVAVKAARALEDLVERDFASVEDFERDLERNSSALRRANPSHASLVTTQRAIVSMVENADAGTAEEAKAALGDAIDSVVERVETAKRRAAENAMDFVEDGATILTHDYSSTVLEAIEQAVSNGRYVTVYVTEARPRYLGLATEEIGRAHV